MEKQSIDGMLASISPQQFKAAALTLHQARSVSVVGARYNSMPAAYAAYFLQAVRDSIRLFTSAEVDLFTKLQDIGPRDAMLVVSTARYPRDTQKMVPLFKEKGAAVVAITDSQISPVIPLADQTLIVPIKFMLSHIDPYAAVMILIHALVAAVSNLDPRKSRARIKDYHRFMDYYDYHAIRDIKLN
jgi:DNA-binding MurR/RpiR family transcriptional regulator